MGSRERWGSGRRSRPEDLTLSPGGVSTFQRITKKASAATHFQPSGEKRAGGTSGWALRFDLSGTEGLRPAGRSCRRRGQRDGPTRYTSSSGVHGRGP